jgi:hypothetical protein
MHYHLAQLNIAEFKLPRKHPNNDDFINNIDRIEALAEIQPGFVWRYDGAGYQEQSTMTFDNPQIASNLSVWEDVGSLRRFVYDNDEHLSFVKRRQEWFEQLDFYMVLWWIKVQDEYLPSLKEAEHKLCLLQELGPTPDAFNFVTPFPCPTD